MLFFKYCMYVLQKFGQTNLGPNFAVGDFAMKGPKKRLNLFLFLWGKIADFWFVGV